MSVNKDMTKVDKYSFILSFTGLLNSSQSEGNVTVRLVPALQNTQFYHSLHQHQLLQHFVRYSAIEYKIKHCAMHHNAVH